ncbi:MAG: hypothetical protein ACRD3H_19115 [Terriglobales bacterium]
MSHCIPRPLCLEFGDEVPSAVRARMSYAFRVFAAIYGHAVIEAKHDRSSGSLNCFYGAGGGNAGARRIAPRYVPRRPEEPAPKPQAATYAKQEFHLFHGRDQVSGNPDWLGEIFEWLSAAHEMSVEARDAIGRIPYAQAVFGSYGISPLRPHASLMMAWFENFIRGGPQLEKQAEKVVEDLPVAPSPLPAACHLVIASHDIDFYFAGRWGSLVRVVKNLGIAVLLARSFAFFKDNAVQLLQLARGRRVGDYLGELLRRSREDGFSSTFFILAEHQHRRDGNYRLEQMVQRLREIPAAGSALALHGSYRSIVENSDLAAEVETLAASTGERPRGSRQHWLRFDHPAKLFSNIEKAGLQYDSSWGWAEQLGFRHGAAFAFPPYNFAAEAPYNFLLIPLVIMDRGLQVAHDRSAEAPAKLAERVLAESRRWGWGGVSVLWHNPVEPLSACSEVNEIFWQLVKAKERHQERWLSAEKFMELSLSRYQQAGLLQEMGTKPAAGLPHEWASGGNGQRFEFDAQPDGIPAVQSQICN